MMSLETIIALSNERAEQAAQDELEPYQPFNEQEIDNYPAFPFPNIGSYEPIGWNRVDDLLCDSSGFGSPNEPAYTINQLIAYIREHLAQGYAYAIIEEGQFQIVLGVFTREDESGN